MPNFKESQNKMKKPSIKMDPPYNLKPVPKGDKGKGLRKLPADVRENMGYKMDSSHSFKMKDALNMKTMYMGSTYSMEPMVGDGDKEKSNPFAVDLGLGKPSKVDPNTMSIGDIEKKEYGEAQSESGGFIGPLNRTISETENTGMGKFEFTTGAKQPSKKIKPASNKREIQKTVNAFSGPSKGVVTGPLDIKVGNTLGSPNNGSSKKITPTPSASKEIRAITPRETRRNERNVKFLKRRVRKAERKGDNSASLRQSLANAQTQQAGNFLPGDKFTQPSSGSTYKTPKQVKQSKKSENKKNRVLKSLKRLTAKKEDGTNVGKAIKKVGGIFKKKPQNTSGFKSSFPF